MIFFKQPRSAICHFVVGVNICKFEQYDIYFQGLLCFSNNLKYLKNYGFNCSKLNEFHFFFQLVLCQQKTIGIVYHSLILIGWFISYFLIFVLVRDVLACDWKNRFNLSKEASLILTYFFFSSIKVLFLLLNSYKTIKIFKWPIFPLQADYLVQ